MQFLAGLIRELPSELVLVSDQLSAAAEHLRIAVNKLKRDAAIQDQNIEAISNRTTDLEVAIQALVNIVTKAAAIEPLAAALESPSEKHPKPEEKE